LDDAITPLRSGPHPFDPLSLRERGNSMRPSSPLSEGRGGQGVKTTGCYGTTRNPAAAKWPSSVSASVIRRSAIPAKLTASVNEKS